MVLAFQLLALALAALAAYFFWSDNTNRMFAAAVLGAVSFFLSIRFQVKGRLRQRELERTSQPDVTS